MWFFLILAACDGGDSPAQPDSGLAARVAALEAALEAIEPSASYTDEQAVAAVQNGDPWSEPERANLTSLWSQTERGYHWLDESRWTMDNRTDPPGATPRHELIQLFHETPECTDGSSFSSCNATSALKMYINGPRITDSDWSDDGLRDAALRRYHTHTSGLYLVSFGQLSYVSDYSYGLIAPSGIHLEPHGAHQALRIDGTGNSGENVRIDTTLGATGIAIYESPQAGLYCAELGGDCTGSYPLYLRGGRLHLEDLTVERSATDARGAGAATLHETSLGIEHFYSWHIDDSLGVPVHCTWSSVASGDSLVKLVPYSTSPDLTVAHSYALVEVWGPGGAPAACLGGQLIKTDASGVYGYSFDEALAAEGGFLVAILGPGGAPLDPGAWQEGQRPAFLYEVLEPL